MWSFQLLSLLLHWRNLLKMTSNRWWVNCVTFVVVYTACNWKQHSFAWQHQYAVSNGLFTPPTRLVRVGGVNTTGDKTKLSCVVHVGDVNTTADKTRQLCLVLAQFPNDVVLCRQVIRLIKWPNFSDWLKNTCFLCYLNYTRFCYLLTDFLKVTSTQWHEFDVG